METQLTDVYQRVTDQIIEAIERGAGDWKMPWHQTGRDCFTPLNASTKRPYRGETYSASKRKPSATDDDYDARLAPPTHLLSRLCRRYA